MFPRTLFDVVRPDFDELPILDTFSIARNRLVSWYPGDCFIREADDTESVDDISTVVVELTAATGFC